MMRSLYSAVSGLKVHQTKMDVIGNNIANVNTVGFKASSVRFSDIYYQTTQAATGANESTGTAGQNAKQIGLGATVASITSSVTVAGGAERTDNASDLMISGNSFFVVNSGGTNYFTKDGSFGVDENGTLCTSSGATVMGWQVDPSDEDSIIKTTVSPLNILAPENLYSEPVATTNTYIKGNIDPNDTSVVSGSTGVSTTVSFYDNLGQSYTAVLNIQQSSTTNEYTVTLEDIYDSNDQSIFVTKNSSGAYVPSSLASGSIKLGGLTYTVTAANIDSTTGKLTTAPTAAGTANTLTFDASTGKFKGIGASNTVTTPSITLDITSASNEFKDIDVDFSTLTQFADGGKSSVNGYKGSIVDGTITNDGAGQELGKMSGYTIDTSGKIYGTYDNGDKKLLGQIATASFTNPAGLESVGGNMFAATLNSGEFDGIGQDVTSDGGSFTTGVLEMSNVDLSTEFTQMITTQRGFQANSRVITTSDSLLEELVNLKR